ncbi:MAG: exported protein of unknown function [Candidatus Saccharibacteria bacterium]|jgi:hypothetical protein|nr:exported protein of unknown function [Candidatus Saccharibacteria bacterium]
MKKSAYTFKQWLKPVGLAAIVLTMGWGAAAHAETADSQPAQRDSIALSPVSQRFELKAGDQATNKVTVINDGNTNAVFVVYARPYSIKNEAYEPEFEKTSKSTDIYQWIEFEKTSYTLKAGERVDIPYEFKVPATAAPGGHYGVVFVETQPEPGTNDSVVRKKRIGSIIMVTVDGGIIKKGSTLDTSVKFWQTIAPLVGASRVENTGNADFSANVTMTVTDMLGSIKFREVKDYVVYPDTIRRIPVSWQNAPWFGLFKVEYKTVVLDKATNSSNYVLMLPRWLAAIGLVLVVLGAGYALIRRKRR